MPELERAVLQAIHLVTGLDRGLLEIVRLSLVVSLSAVALASLVGLPLGAALALTRFPGRAPIVVAINACMGLPPVVVGLAVYMALSRAGPLGPLGLLFTPQAMVIAQTILVLPIITALTRQTIDEHWQDYRDLVALDGVPLRRTVLMLLRAARAGIVVNIMAGLGRAFAEVGAILIVGGNIAGVTRTMTTAIALETSKGDLPLALGLGMVLIALTFTINAVANLLRVPARGTVP